MLFLLLCLEAEEGATGMSPPSETSPRIMCSLLCSIEIFFSSSKMKTIQDNGANNLKKDQADLGPCDLLPFL